MPRGGCIILCLSLSITAYSASVYNSEVFPSSNSGSYFFFPSAFEWRHFKATIRCVLCVSFFLRSAHRRRLEDERRIVFRCAHGGRVQMLYFVGEPPRAARFLCPTHRASLSFVHRLLSFYLSSFSCSLNHFKPNIIWMKSWKSWLFFFYILFFN